MIFYAVIMRTRDGLILSASTEAESLREVKDSKRYLKLLSKKISTFPDRCSLRLNPLVVHFISSLGVSFLVLCEANYPCVLAFSFLNELMKEFIVSYNTPLINNVVRPYSFIEFDNFVYKLRQRYNSPRTLTTKLNLPDLSTEIKLRPPHLLSLQNILPSNEQEENGFNVVNFTHRLTPITWLGIISMALNGFCALFNIVRALSALSESNLEEYEGSSPIHGISFLLEAILQCFQVNLLLRYPKQRILLVYFSFFCICLCNLFVWKVRDTWQIMLHVGLASALTFNVVTRKMEPKAANYNV